MTVDNYQNTTTDIIEFLDKVKDESPDSVMTMYFVHKPSREKFVSFMPQISTALQKRILEMVLPVAIKSLQYTVVSYNPVGVADKENELIHPTQVESVEKFLESLNDDNICKDMSELNIGRINFYSIKISYEGKTVYLFRQFSKMSKLRKGLMSQIVNNELKEMDTDFLGIDEMTDMVLQDDVLLILNHISLERIFNYRDEYLKITNAAIGEIVNQGIIENVEQFSEDCQRDVRIMKRFTDMMSKDRLPLFFDHYDKVPEIVEALNLDLEFNDDGKIIYREKSQLFHIINLMSDAYFKSLLAERLGVAKIEDTL
jgi:hypothetical protein